MVDTHNVVDSVITADALSALLSAPKVEQQAELKRVNEFLAELTPVQRVRWALAYLPGKHALSSSFGIQAAVMLHMVSAEK
ncbi:phosphoadenosine phosphosulfate reductase, partial [Shewanella sp. 0m-11]